VLLAFAVARLFPEVKSNSLEPGWVAAKMGGAAHWAGGSDRRTHRRADTSPFEAARQDGTEAARFVAERDCGDRPARNLYL